MLKLLLIYLISKYAVAKSQNNDAGDVAQIRFIVADAVMLISTIATQGRDSGM